ncbi:MAG TPA: hypothetical protein VM925_29835 [Labilithrix sp.]|nr:hypothetical protein [Labilithrix sp.]
MKRLIVLSVSGAVLVACTTEVTDTPLTRTASIGDAAPVNGEEDPGSIVADLRADTNRDGVVSFDGKADDDGEDDWNEEHGAIIAKSLGGVGNAWAWRTLSNQAEASATRAIAARALVDIYVSEKNAADVREQAAKAILVVDAPSTPSLIARARTTASHDTLAMLDELERRFASNPTR